jgi:hypothetical protein
MHTSTVPETYRRSSRVPFTLPMLVTSLQPGLQFSEVCETLMVNAHGCSVRSPIHLEAGLPVHLHSKEGRETTARVVACEPIGTDKKSWLVGAQLDEPANFWGLSPCPADWLSVPEKGNGHAKLLSGDKLWQKTDTALKTIPQNVREELSDDRMRSIISETLSETLKPMQATVAELQEKLAEAPAKRSNFEVSLSYIPPELEEKLWTRLRQDLGAQVLEYATERSDKVLLDAKDAIRHQLAAAQEEFLEQVRQELGSVEVRAQRLSDEIDDGVRVQLRAGLERVQQNIFEAGARLEQRSDEFYEGLRQRLGQDHEARLREITQLQASATVEAERQKAAVAELSEKVGELNQSARHLEAELDHRLTRVSSEIVAGARTQIESDAAIMLKQIESRNAAELGNQLDAACSRLKLVQKGIEIAAAELLRAKVAETLQTFQDSMQELAGETVGRWRQALARDLSSVARTLGGEVRAEARSENQS